MTIVPMIGPMQGPPMFSKKWVLAAMAILSIWGLGCTPEIGEKPPEYEGIGLSSTQCLGGATDSLKNFFAGKARDEELLSAWTCVEEAVIQFEKYVRGSQSDSYTSQEIVEFLEKNFLSEADAKKHKISPALQYEMMKLKRVFIGGSVAHVTRAELRSTQNFVQQISRITRKLNPFMKIIVMSWKPNLNKKADAELEEFEKANAGFQVFAKELAEIVRAHESTYKLDDALSLVKEFEKFFQENWGWVDQFEKGLPGAKKLKLTLAGGNENIITNREWSPVMTLGARAYFQFLRFHYFIKETPLTGGGVQLVYISRTMEDVFSIFEDLLSNKKNGVITRFELYDILKAFGGVWPDLKVSEKLVLELMRIKQVLIGGSIEYWSIADFEAARLKVPEVRNVVELFLPYYNVYTFSWDPNSESEEKARSTLAEASDRLQKVAMKVGQTLTGSYSYKEVLVLVKEIEAVYGKGSQDKTPVSEILAQYEPLFLEANKLIFGREDSVIPYNNWTQVLPLVARFYSLYQFQDYFMKDKSLKKTRTLEDMGILVDDGIVAVNKILEIKKEGYFTQNELVNLFATLSKAGILPKSIKTKTYESLWTALLQHFLFDPARRLKGEKNNLLKSEQLTILRQEFYNWRVTQVALNGLFRTSGSSYKHTEMMKALKDAVNSSSNLELKNGLSEVYALLDASVTQTLDSEDQLQISNRYDWVYKANALFQANMSRMLSRLLIRSFSEEKALTRVTECNADRAVNLLAGIFRDLNIFEIGPDFIGPRFLEANIFTIRGNGDQFVDKYELSEMITIIFSGLSVHDKLQVSLMHQCAAGGRGKCQIYTEGSGKKFVTVNDLSEHHYVAVRKYLTQMPDFKAYVEKLAAQDSTSPVRAVDAEDSPTTPAPNNPEDEFENVAARSGFQAWNNNFRALLKASGWKPNNGYGNVKKEAIYLDDALFYPFIVHYVELIFSRYDTVRKDGIIQTVEARKAFPTFRPLLKTLAQAQIDGGLIKEEDLLAVFTFIMRYQEAPSISNFFKWGWWKSNPDKWDVWASRTELAKILDYIATMVAQNSDGETTTNKCAKKIIADDENPEDLTTMGMPQGGIHFYQRVRKPVRSTPLNPSDAEFQAP